MENSLQTILSKHKAATGFFTGLGNLPGDVIYTSGSIPEVINELESAINERTLSEKDLLIAKVLLKEYKVINLSSTKQIDSYRY